MHADTEVIARTINRAAKLSDGAKLYFPLLGDPSAAVGQPLSAGSLGSIAPNVPNPFNINTASESELEALSGIGPVTAGKIIAGRPYMRLEELVEKKVLSQSLFTKLNGQLAL
jgi:competence protein ComEA